MIFRDLDKKSILENSARILSTISVVGTDITFTEETNLSEWEYEDYRFVPENGFIGQFTERLLDGKFKNLPQDFSLENKEINLKLGIINGIDNKTTYYDYGNFLITKVGEKDTTGTTSYESSDYAKIFNQEYVDTIAYPCLALELANNVCEQVGIKLASNGDAYCYAVDDDGLQQGDYSFFINNTYYNFTTIQDLKYHDTLMISGNLDNIIQKHITPDVYIVDRTQLPIVTSTYRNILDVSKFVPGRLDNGVIGYTTDSEITSYDSHTGSITYETTRNYRGIVSDYLPIDSTKSYVGQYASGGHFNLDWYDNNKQWISRGGTYNWTDGTVSYCVPVIPTNAAYVVINPQLSTAGTGTFKNLQFIESDSYQAFIPYSTILQCNKTPYVDFVNNDFSIENNQFTEVSSCRDVIKAIAKLGYTWARIGEDNKLYFDFEPKTSDDVDNEYNSINTDQYYSEESQLEMYGPVNKVLLGISNIEGENVYKEQTTDEVTICNILGATSQASTPTPTSPVPVKVVNSVRIDVKVNDEVKSSLNVDLQGYELCSGDTLVINNGYGKITKTFNKVVFTGDENWVKQNTQGSVYRYSFILNDEKKVEKASDVSNAISNRFVTTSASKSYEGNTGIAVSHNDKKFFICYMSNETNTRDKFIAWLRANPTYAYYELEKPIEIDLGYVGNIELFEGNDIIAIYTTDTDTTGSFVVSDIYKNTTKYSGNNIKVPVKGYKTCQIDLYDNPILYTQELRLIALNGCDRLFGLKYLPFTTTTVGHPWLKGDDYIKLTNLDDKVLYTYSFDRKLTYKGYIKSEISSTAKTYTEQQYEFSSELVNKITHAEIIVNQFENKINANTEKITQLEQGVDNANINTNNLRDSINSALNDYAKSDDVTQLRQAVETQQTETNLKIDIINEVLEDGVSKIKTTKGYTFDDDGLSIADSESEIKSKLDNKSFEVRDNTSGHGDTELLYAGVDSETKESVVRSENLTVKKYFTIGTNSRFEDFEKNNKPGTGVFFIG